jgi:hypothetical protein
VSSDAEADRRDRGDESADGGVRHDAARPVGLELESGQIQARRTA